MAQYAKNTGADNFAYATTAGYVKSLKYAMDTVLVEWSDGKLQTFNAVNLGCEWFKMSNDHFYEKYGFNFNPHTIPGLYEKCRRIVYS